MQKVVIIGAGHAGIQAATSLRKEGFQGSIQLIARETEFPYQKPPLSKDFLKGKVSEKNLAFRSLDFYQKNNIDLQLGIHIRAIDIAQQKVFADNGITFPYDQLIIATGAANRILKIEGYQSKGIHYLRTLADSQNIKTGLAAAQKVVVIGGGFIGLELAAVAIANDKEVTVIEAQDRLMARVLPPILTGIFRAEHETQGVQFHFNAFAHAFKEKEGKIAGVYLKNGDFIPADIVLVGIGVMPNIAVAEHAGLACEDGITVNEYMQTSQPNIFAIGDCANHFNPFAKKNLRLESVQNAVDQAKTVARFICGNSQIYKEVPWFWTHQYRLKLQMAGFNTDFDELFIRGDLAAKKCSIFYYKNQQLIGVDSLNKPADHLAARKLIQKGISPTREAVLNTSVKLKELVL